MQKLSIGYLKKLDQSILNDRHTLRIDILDKGIDNMCWGKCGKSRLKCLKQQKLNILHDRKVLKSQEGRYDSWMQTIRQNTHQIPLYQQFHKLALDK